MNRGYASLQLVYFLVQFRGIEFFRFNAIHAVAGIADRFERFLVQRQATQALLDLVKTMCNRAWQVIILQQVADNICTMYAQLYILAVHLVGVQCFQHAGPDVNINIVRVIRALHAHGADIDDPCGHVGTFQVTPDTYKIIGVIMAHGAGQQAGYLLAAVDYFSEELEAPAARQGIANMCAGIQQQFVYLLDRKSVV